MALNYTPGSYERRRGLVEDAVAMARGLSSPRTLAACLQNYWLCIWAPGTIERRHRAYEELDQLGAVIDDPVWHALAQPRRIVHAVECCDIDRAWRLADDFDSMAEELGLPLVRWMAGFHRAGLLEIGGDLEGAQKVADEALTHGQAAGQPDAPLFHSVQIGMVQLWHDDYEVLVETLEGVHQIFPDVPGLPTFLALMLQRAGRADDAIAVVARHARARPATWPPTAPCSPGGARSPTSSIWRARRNMPPPSSTSSDRTPRRSSATASTGTSRSRSGSASSTRSSVSGTGPRRRSIWPTTSPGGCARRSGRRSRPRNGPGCTRGAAELGDRDRALELLDLAAELAEPRGAELLRHRRSLVLADLD